MRYNWGNLPFDMREESTDTSDQAPVEEGRSQEQEDLSSYAQDVEEGEATTEQSDGEIESDKQV